MRRTKKYKKLKTKTKTKTNFKKYKYNKTRKLRTRMNGGRKQPTIYGENSEKEFLNEQSSIAMRQYLNDLERELYQVSGELIPLEDEYNNIQESNLLRKCKEIQFHKEHIKQIENELAEETDPVNIRRLEFTITSTKSHIIKPIEEKLRAEFGKIDCQEVENKFSVINERFKQLNNRHDDLSTKIRTVRRSLGLS